MDSTGAPFPSRHRCRHGVACPRAGHCRALWVLRQRPWRRAACRLRSLRRYRRGAAGRGSRCDHPCGGEQHRGGRRQGRTCRCLRFSRAPGGHSAVQRPLHAHHRDAGPLLFTNHYFRNQRLLGTSGRPPAAAGLHQATPPRESDTSYPCLNPADIHVLIHII